MSFLFEPATDTQITHLRRLWLYVVAALILFFLTMPSALVVILSFTASTLLEFPPRAYSLRWYANFFGSPEWRSATQVSFIVATLTAAIATPAGVAAAYGIHVGRFKNSSLWSTLLILPMLIPVILIAIGAFFVFVPARLNNTVTGLVVAHTALSIPFVFVVILARLRSYDLNQELAAQSLGASRFQSFVKVTVPQIKFSIITATLLAFIHSLDEVVVAFFVATGDASTLTRRMFLALQFGIDPTIAAISTCLIVLTIICVLVTQLVSVERGKRGPYVPLQ